MRWGEPEGRITEVWRDDSPPAFTAETPNGSHAAWWFSVGGKDFGPYFTRRDAEEAAQSLAITRQGGLVQ